MVYQLAIGRAIFPWKSFAVGAASGLVGAPLVRPALSGVMKGVLSIPSDAIDAWKDLRTQSDMQRAFASSMYHMPPPQIASTQAPSANQAATPAKPVYWTGQGYVVAQSPEPPSQTAATTTPPAPPTPDLQNAVHQLAATLKQEYHRRDEVDKAMEKLAEILKGHKSSSG